MAAGDAAPAELLLDALPLRTTRAANRSLGLLAVEGRAAAASAVGVAGRGGGGGGGRRRGAVRGRICCPCTCIGPVALHLRSCRRCRHGACQRATLQPGVSGRGVCGRGRGGGGQSFWCGSGSGGHGELGAGDGVPLPAQLPEIHARLQVQPLHDEGLAVLQHLPGPPGQVPSTPALQTPARPPRAGPRWDCRHDFSHRAYTYGRLRRGPKHSLKLHVI